MAGFGQKVRVVNNTQVASLHFFIETQLAT